MRNWWLVSRGTRSRSLVLIVLDPKKKKVFLFGRRIGWMNSYLLLHLTLAWAQRPVIRDKNRRPTFWWWVPYTIVSHIIRPTSIACLQWIAKRINVQSLVTSVRWLTDIRWAATKWCHTLSYLLMVSERKVVLASPLIIHWVLGRHKFFMT